MACETGQDSYSDLNNLNDDTVAIFEGLKSRESSFSMLLAHRDNLLQSSDDSDNETVVVQTNNITE